MRGSIANKETIDLVSREISWKEIRKYLGIYDIIFVYANPTPCSVTSFNSPSIAFTKSVRTAKCTGANCRFDQDQQSN